MQDTLVWPADASETQQVFLKQHYATQDHHHFFLWRKSVHYVRCLITQRYICRNASTAHWEVVEIADTKYSSPSLVRHRTLSSAFLSHSWMRIRKSAKRKDTLTDNEQTPYSGPKSVWSGRACTKQAARSTWSNIPASSCLVQNHNLNLSIPRGG